MRPRSIEDDEDAAPSCDVDAAGRFAADAEDEDAEVSLAADADDVDDRELQC